ncbi:unnamed protein product [Allacma fusca]|uniref:Uncharacterized protein n=1 Tax=Allacma fusca TaxID=39272 RepID=A0A8J2LGZ2_9HEXA|nr:unnamed protein product [Allacma fusca]
MQDQKRLKREKQNWAPLLPVCLSYSQHDTSERVRLGVKDEQQVNRTASRIEYFRNNYDVMTGLRIAGTLGGFFVLVLLTLLYKSKCKKSSREPSPVPMGVVGPTLPTPRASVIHSSLQERSSLAVVTESPQYMTQMNHKYFNKPAVLLTAANSESSDEDFSISGFVMAERGGGGRLRACQGDLLKCSPHSGSSPKHNMKWFQQSIDIHVILPTPTISPSSSETFTRVRMKKDRSILEFGDYLSVDGSESEMSALVPPAGALCFAGNLKYVDDTSSENIPTRASDYDDQDNDSRRSIGSDSVFACYDSEYGPEISVAPPPPPPPPVPTPPPRYTRKRCDKPNLRRKSSSFYDNEDDDECECRMTLTQAQVHHRDSYCGSELESVNDYLESHRRRSSSTQTTLSDLRQCLNSYVGSSVGSNASSQSQSRHSPNPFPHLSPYFNFNTGASPSSTLPASTTSSSLIPSPPNNPILLRVNPVSNFTQSRKRSYDTLKKTYSLQCDEPNK